MRTRHYQSGPLIWFSILACTCLLLVLFQKVLWLVIPFLLSMILYYLLAPLQQRLILAGYTRNSSALLVCGGTYTLAGAAILLSIPQVSARLLSWQDSGQHYLQGGWRLLAETIHWAESHSHVAAQAHLTEQISTQLQLLGDKVTGRYLATAAMHIAGWLPSLLLVPFLVFFFLRDGWRFKLFLSRAVPNAFFERSLYLLDQVDHTTKLYFQGLMKLTLLDTLCLAMGLWLIGISSPLALGIITAVLAWIPYIGSILGCLLVVLVAATDFPATPSMAYAAIALFLAVRMLDDFIFMPLTIGRSLRLHPLLTMVMIFVGGAVAGITGLMLVLPLLGIVMVLGETAGAILTDARLRARHAHARQLMRRAITKDLQL